MIDDKVSAISRTLNADFFKPYKLDAYFPADWKLSLIIKNKSALSMFTGGDKEIGVKHFDLEDRFYGNQQRLNKIAYSLRLEHYNSLKLKLRDKRMSLDTKLDRKKEIDKVQTQIRNLNEYLKPKISGREEEPIEYCSLSQTGRKTMQGNVELVLQVLDINETRDVPMPKFEAPVPQEFEIRLIIWSVKDVPLGGKKSMDIFVRTTMDIDGWRSKSVVKNTDAHLNSDGNGEYNYRQLFQLKLPCKFPWIKIAVFDFAAFSSSQSIGSVTLKLENVIPKIKSEGRFESKQRSYQLQNGSSFQSRDAGSVSVSFKIISKSEAMNNPVGEGQDAPNHSPFLEKPTKGRDMADFLASRIDIGFSFGLLFRFMKYIGGAGAVGMLFWVLFVSPGEIFWMWKKVVICCFLLIFAHFSAIW